MQALLGLGDVGELVGEQGVTAGCRHRAVGRVAHEDHAGAADRHGVGVALAVELLGEATVEHPDVTEVDAELGLVARAQRVVEGLALTGARRDQLQQALGVPSLGDVPGELVRELLRR